MIFSKGRILGLFCIVATLAGAIFVLHEAGLDGDLSRLDGLLRADVLFLLFLLYGAHFLAEPVRWAMYCRHPFFVPARGGVDFTGIFACFNITALLSYSLPFKLGLPLRLVLLSQFLGIDGSKAIRLMVLDGVFSLLCWAFIAFALLLLLPELGAFVSAHVEPLYLVPVLLAAAAAGYGLWRWKGLGFLAQLRAVPAGLALLVTLTLAVDILLYGARHVVLADILAVDIDAGKMFVIGIVAVFAGIVSTLPMGLGAYDASLVGLLALYGVELELGLLLALGNRLAMIFTSIILGVPSSLVMLKKDTGVTEG